MCNTMRYYTFYSSFPIDSVPTYQGTVRLFCDLIYFYASAKNRRQRHYVLGRAAGRSFVVCPSVNVYLV